MSLSSCEAELHAIQAGVQESIGLARTLAFVLKSLNLREDLAPAQDRFPFRKTAFGKLRLATAKSPHRDTSVLAAPASEQFHLGVDILQGRHEFV